MSIDWSKAPEGATHYFTGSDSPWRDLSDESWKWLNASGIWTDTGDSSAMLMARRPERLIARPAPSAWSGEGLPPVGVVCEVDGGSSGDGWGRCVIRYSSPDVIVFKRDEYDFESFDCAGGEYSFRPIRTPEQIAAEERENELNRMVATVSMLDKGWARKVCAGLYDAGYRRQEMP